MRKNHCILFFVLLTFNYSIKSQNWPRIYTDSADTYTFDVFEHYDKGYLLSGCFYLDGFHEFGWTMKTDINGNIKWKKVFGELSSSSIFMGSSLTFDGGVIFTGGKYIVSTKINPLIVKINACGEKEWCKIFSSIYPNSFGNKIIAVPGGGYMALILQWINPSDVWLFRLDSTGNIIWLQNYAADPNIFNNPYAQGILQTSDTCILITGHAYSPDSLYPGYKVLKLFTIKVDLNGEVIFQTPWGNNNGIISDGGFDAEEDSEKNFFIAARRARNYLPYGDSPCLFKTSSTGDPIFYKDLRDNSDLGMAGTINWFQDSTLAFCAYWKINDKDTMGVIKTNSSGDVLKVKSIFTNAISGIRGSDITFDNKLIVGGEIDIQNNISNACLVKLNSDLDYDSIYTYPYTYDSLCPYPIISDTIPLNDCDVVTSVFNPKTDTQKTILHIYPNPVKNLVTIEMPKYLTRQSKGFGYTATTIYHQWNSSTLEIYNLFGKLMYSKEIPKKTEKIEMDISSWYGGMYVARVVYMNEIVAGTKFVIE